MEKVLTEGQTQPQDDRANVRPLLDEADAYAHARQPV